MQLTVSSRTSAPTSPSTRRGGQPPVASLPGGKGGSPRTTSAPRWKQSLKRSKARRSRSVLASSLEPSITRTFATHGGKEMSVPVFRLEPLGRLVPLVSPDEGVSRSDAVVGAVRPSINASRTLVGRGYHRTWVFDQSSLVP